MTAQDKARGETFVPIGARGFGWRVLYEHSDTWIDFKAYEVCSTDTDGGHPRYKKKDWRAADFTEDLDEAESIDGYVKWDGCMEIDMGHEHFCGADNIANYCKLLTALHALCKLLPSVDLDCAGYEERTASATGEKP